MLNDMPTMQEKIEFIKKYMCIDQFKDELVIDKLYYTLQNSDSWIEDFDKSTVKWEHCKSRQFRDGILKYHNFEKELLMDAKIHGPCRVKRGICGCRL